MKTYKITISGKEIEVTQNEDGSFNKPDIVKELEPIGTALKPAFEPICMAMKPLSEKNYVANVLKYGTGGINIDESRVETQEELGRQQYSKTSALKCSNYEDKFVDPSGGLGRFPANLLHDNSDEVRECFPETKSGWTNKDTQKSNSMFLGAMDYTGTHYADSSGNASRFFKSIIYQAKASKSERNAGLDDFEEKQTPKMDGGEFINPMTGISSKSTMRQNFHPTVKPITLMEYLIKMVTPKGGIVLDPFAGSGSTLVAAKQNGFKYIGIEMTKEYIPIIEARLNTVKEENTLF